RRDRADPIASQGHDDQAKGVGDVTYWAEEINAECWLSVRASGYEPVASSHHERSCLKPPFHRLPASVFEWIRWHPQARVISQDQGSTLARWQQLQCSDESERNAFSFLIARFRSRRRVGNLFQHGVGIRL